MFQHEKQTYEGFAEGRGERCMLHPLLRLSAQPLACREAVTVVVATPDQLLAGWDSSSLHL